MRSNLSLDEILIILGLFFFNSYLLSGYYNKEQSAILFEICLIIVCKSSSLFMLEAFLFLIDPFKI